MRVEPGDRPVNGIHCNRAGQETGFPTREVIQLIKQGYLYGGNLNGIWYISDGAYRHLLSKKKYFESVLRRFK